MLDRSFGSFVHGVVFFSFAGLQHRAHGNAFVAGHWKFLEASTYQVTDVDGELAELDYYHPLTDPISGTTLDNRIVVNGVEVPHGARGGRPACNNNIDDDGDGQVDRIDPGCPSSTLFSYASTESPQCDDGLDNDGNGLVDFSDPKCSPSWPYWEKAPACGLGAELALVMPLISLAASRRRRAN